MEGEMGAWKQEVEKNMPSAEELRKMVQDTREMQEDCRKQAEGIAKELGLAAFVRTIFVFFPPLVGHISRERFLR